MSDEEEEEHCTRHDTESTGEEHQSLPVGDASPEVGNADQERQQDEVGPPVRLSSCGVARVREG